VVDEAPVARRDSHYRGEHGDGYPGYRGEHGDGYPGEHGDGYPGYRGDSSGGGGGNHIRGRRDGHRDRFDEPCRRVVSGKPFLDDPSSLWWPNPYGYGHRYNTRLPSERLFDNCAGEGFAPAPAPAPALAPALAPMPVAARCGCGGAISIDMKTIIIIVVVVLAAMALAASGRVVAAVEKTLAEALCLLRTSSRSHSQDRQAQLT
jgi:hypothetical protein